MSADSIGHEAIDSGSAKRLTIEEAVARLRDGAVLGYPTEAVWGLGCDPFNETAVRQILMLKHRPIEKGLIIVAASIEQVRPIWSQLPEAVQRRIMPTWPGPNTWVLPDTNSWMPDWVRGSHSSVAVRISAHPTIQALCEAFGGPIVSTSANPAAYEPARNAQEVLEYFADLPIVEGEVGRLRQPTTITDAVSGNILR